VRFYELPAEAERDGLRPCLRCRPLKERADEPTLNKIREVCSFICSHSDSGEDLTLERLGALAALSPFHLQRTFKAVLGISPKQYLAACRVNALKSQLRNGRSVTDSVYEAGFGSSSRVYEQVDTSLGMTPGQYQSGGKGVEISYATAKTSLGIMLIAATDRGLCSVQFGDSAESLLTELQREYPQASISESKSKSSQFGLWIDSLSRYLAGQSVPLDLPLDVRATAFQLKVWRYLQTIPTGETRTYSQVAQAIGEPNASRAVGRACGSNQVAIVIPCHRVIRGDQTMGGYRWGLERKEKLLERERSAKI
jgi:AraC family transcriptional regulator of adaptative response/methylated-DNA-[protein]-cysteine methyltransferase